MKRKPAKGDLRRNKLHIPHPVRRLRRTGLVRSVVPPLPTRIASLDSRGSPVPFANPLKTTKKGGCGPPSLDFPRSSVCAEIISDLQNAIQMRIWQTGEVIEILCVCFDFHTSNIQRAQAKRLARRIVRLGNPILRPPEGRFDDGNETTKRKTERQAFQARKRYFASSVSFCILFSDKPEKSMSAKRYSTNWVQKGGCNAIPASISRRAVGPQSH